jgi:DNA ligase (NAD+)
LDFSRLLFGLGIRHVGERTAQLLARHFSAMDDVMNATADELEQVREVGPEIAESIRRFFHEPQNRALIERLRASGLPMESSAPRTRAPQTFEGKTFVITGTLDSMTREEATALIEEHGGRVTSSVSKKTSFLLAGADPGSKLDKAREIGVPIIDEKTLRGML